MEVFEGQSILNFIRKLPNDEACKAYLAQIKWQDGFTCISVAIQKAVKNRDIIINVMAVNM